MSASLPDRAAFTDRKQYSFDSHVGIPIEQQGDLQRFFENFYLNSVDLQPETILLARRFFQRHISNIVYYNQKIRQGNRTYWWIVVWSMVAAVIAPVLALLITRLGIPPATGGSSLAVVIVGVVLSGIIAAWKLIQSLALASVRLNEWRRTAQKLRSELYRLEAKRRGAVQAKMRDAVRNGAENAIAVANSLTADEEATLRDEFQAGITAAEALVEAEVDAHFAAIYDVNKLSSLLASIGTSVAPVEKAFEVVGVAKINEATKRAEAEAADRKLERLGKARDERAIEYQNALRIEMGLTIDGKPWDSGEAKPRTPEQMGELVTHNKLRKRLLEEITSIDTEWNALRKLQRERAV